MRLFLIVIAVAAASSIVLLPPAKTPANTHSPAVSSLKAIATKNSFKRVQSFAGEVKLYAAKHHYNTHYCFLIDMKIPCGSNRFFVYDLTKDSICKAGLVTHGYGNSNGANVSFSNVPGSNSSSVGKYKIGASYNGKFGLAFKLYGLDSTNSNAFNRFVVLHSHDCVPAAEVAPQSICMSQGCPTVAPAFLKSLKVYLDNAEEPILLRIFY